MSPRSQSILFAIAWIVVGGCFLGAGFAVEMSLNFFDWRPRLTLGLLIALAVYIGAISASLALHRPSRGIRRTDDADSWSLVPMAPNGRSAASRQRGASNR